MTIAISVTNSHQPQVGYAAWRRRFAPFLVLLACGLSACAGTVKPMGSNDPWEQTNRAIFNFNDRVETHIAFPVAEFYHDNVPEPARDGVHNVLTNISLPVTFGNELLQGEFTRGAQTLGRLGINSTLGVAGIFDVASKLGIPFHTEDFGQTLGVWGVGSGPYFVAPFLGPAPPRDLAGDIVDTFMDPFFFARFPSDTAFYATRSTLGVIDLTERNMDYIKQIKGTSIDYYAAMRSIYMQHRQAEIDNATGGSAKLPEF